MCSSKSDNQILDVFLQSAKYSAGLQKVTTRLVTLRSAPFFCESFIGRFKKMLRSTLTKSGASSKSDNQNSDILCQNLSNPEFSKNPLRAKPGFRFKTKSDFFRFGHFFGVFLIHWMMHFLKTSIVSMCFYKVQNIRRVFKK
jgi:hypothetical protein